MDFFLIQTYKTTFLLHQIIVSMAGFDVNVTNK